MFIADSCLVQTYHKGVGEDSDCLDEAFLKAQKGPAVVLTSIPWGSSYHWEVMSDQKRGFWEDLFGGKSIGQALYDHCDGAWHNPIHLFGDPSLVVFGEPEVDLDPPDIMAVAQVPILDKVMTVDSVDVNSTVVDEESGVGQVFLGYTNGNGTWFKAAMTKLEGDVWTSTIPPFAYDTDVTYRIVAEDNMGNVVTTDDLGYEFEYTVIPDFAGWLLLPFAMLATLLVLALNKRLKKHNEPI